MKGKSYGVVSVVCVFLAVLLFSYASEIIAGVGPNPSVPAGFKVMGPNLKGTLIVGYYPNVQNPGWGFVEAYLLVEGKFYAAVLSADKPEDVFLATSPMDITSWEFPKQIAADHNMDPLETKVVVLSEKDVLTFGVREDMPSGVEPGLGIPLSFIHMLYCEVKISFLVSEKKQ